MYTITVIGTFHSELGKCNSTELYKIIEAIRPEVIFEELPEDLFDLVYRGNELEEEPLEIKCLRKYLKSYNCIHIPVDSPLSYNLWTRESAYMFNTFQQYYIYKAIELEQNSRTKQEGFSYLNSPRFLKTAEKKMEIERSLLASIGNREHITKIHKSFYEENNIREYAWLRNIYDYSSKKQYNMAVFLIGALHLTSIRDKITEFQTKEDLKLNWTFYNV